MKYSHDYSLVQYYEAELEKLAPHGVEVGNPLLPLIGDMVMMLTEEGELLSDGSRNSNSWTDHDAKAERIVYFHEPTGWSVLLSWFGIHGVEGHRLDYFNAVHLNSGFVRTREFGGSMDLVMTYQALTMDLERPFWDLFSALVENHEDLPKIEHVGYESIVEQLELGMACVLFP